MDVETRQSLPDELPAARYGEISLTPDKTGFFYERYGDVTPRVMFHELGTDLSEDKMLFGEGYEKHHIPVTLLSDDGRWLIVHVIGSFRDLRGPQGSRVTGEAACADPAGGWGLARRRIALEGVLLIERSGGGADAGYQAVRDDCGGSPPPGTWRASR